jgi:hypothetical protein
MKTIAEPSLTAPPPVTFAAAFWYWLKLGFISFGGPTGQIAIMHQDLVENKRWISERRFLHALNYCMVLPGPEATQLATYIGWMMHKTSGGIVAGALFVLAVARHPDRAGVDLHGIRQPAGDCGVSIRHQACRHRDRSVRSVSNRVARIEECSVMVDCRRRFHRHLCAQAALSLHRARGRSDRLSRWTLRAGKICDRRRSRSHGPALRRRVDR